MARPRQLFNGDIIYPKKGSKPPPVPDGFWADEHDPWLMHVIFKECKYRSRKTVTTPCGAEKYHYWCDRIDSTTNFFNCEACNGQ